jgi:hypothetical protein
MENNEQKEIVIDFSVEGKHLNESFLGLFGFGVKQILKYVFGETAVPVTVRGSNSDVKSFANTISREKKYIESIKKHGLDNPKTFKNKSLLKTAISKFERATGLKWPVK